MPGPAALFSRKRDVEMAVTMNMWRLEAGRVAAAGGARGRKWGLCHLYHLP